jgi:hypothetical protein
VFSLLETTNIKFPLSLAVNQIYINFLLFHKRYDKFYVHIGSLEKAPQIAPALTEYLTKIKAEAYTTLQKYLGSAVNKGATEDCASSTLTQPILLIIGMATTLPSLPGNLDVLMSDSLGYFNLRCLTLYRHMTLDLESIYLRQLRQKDPNVQQNISKEAKDLLAEVEVLLKKSTITLKKQWKKNTDELVSMLKGF